MELMRNIQENVKQNVKLASDEIKNDIKQALNEINSEDTLIIEQKEEMPKAVRFIKRLDKRNPVIKSLDCIDVKQNNSSNNIE